MKYGHRPCGVPNCPLEKESPWKRDPTKDDPNCLCGKPLMISLPPGEHMHCPVHPDVIVARGSSVVCSSR